MHAESAGFEATLGHNARADFALLPHLIVELFVVHVFELDGGQASKRVRRREEMEMTGCQSLEPFAQHGGEMQHTLLDFFEADLFLKFDRTLKAVEEREVLRREI